MHKITVCYELWCSVCEAVGWAEAQQQRCSSRAGSGESTGGLRSQHRRGDSGGEAAGQTWGVMGRRVWRGSGEIAAEKKRGERDELTQLRRVEKAPVEHRRGDSSGAEAGKQTRRRVSSGAGGGWRGCGLVRRDLSDVQV